MFEFYWEQCPLCGHWMLLVARLRFTHVKSCYTPECTYWEIGGDGLEPESSLPPIEGVSFVKVKGKEA